MEANKELIISMCFEDLGVLTRRKNLLKVCDIDNPGAKTSFY